MNSWIELVSRWFQETHFTASFLDAGLKSFVMLGLAAGACTLWRSSSAAARHLIWFLAAVVLLCLPLLSSMLPAWEKPLWSVSTGFDSGNRVSLAMELGAGKKFEIPASDPQPSAGGVEKASAGGNQTAGARKLSAQFSANWLVFGFVVWAVGMMTVLISVAVGQIRLSRFSRSAQLLRNTDWVVQLDEARETLGLWRAVNLWQSSGSVMPLTWGWWRPVVLLHELAHVKRWDCPTQIIASLACALYWFNPLVWLAARQMCVERERACDDLVLSGGCRPSDYASHLVEIAGSFRRLPQVAAIAMARPAGLEQRVAAIVDASRERCLRPITLLAILTVVGAIIFSVGGCKTSTVNRLASQSDPLRQQQIAQLKAFSVLKEKQSQALAAAAGESFLPEYRRYFAAAIKGDGQAVTNMYESFKRRHPQYGKKGQHSEVSLRTSYWSPVLEISLAYDHVIRCEPKYTQLAVDEMISSIPAGGIYFGGTDPGRGLPTAFSKSHADADPFYTLTQNALADGTYLEYLQNTYGDRSKLLGRLSAARRADSELRGWDVQWSAAVKKLDALEINDNDPAYDAAQKAVYALEEKRNERTTALLGSVKTRTDVPMTGDNRVLYIPTTEDSQKCFQDYIMDAQQRLLKHQLKPGEDVKEVDGRVQISGQVAVMEINARLARIIFDKNPGHEFFIEESFPLDWMYPHLEPHGLIMKINRQPLGNLSEEIVRKDQEYWRNRTLGMIGGWLNENTSVQEVATFADKVFIRHDLDGFTGDPRFVQNDYSCRMFSKLRSSSAGLYAWRVEHATAADDKEQLARAADFAFRQAFALCPYSPEVAKRYADFLKSQNREADAALITQTAERLKTKSSAAKSAVFQLRLVLDAASTNSEPMTIVYQSGFAGSNKLARVLNVEKNVLLDHTAIQSAKLVANSQGHPEIDIVFTRAGREKFAEVTRRNIERQLAVVMDGQVWSAPVIKSEISGGWVNITGSFSEQEAKAMTAKINEAAGK